MQEAVWKCNQMPSMLNYQACNKFSLLKARGVGGIIQHRGVGDVNPD